MAKKPCKDCPDLANFQPGGPLDLAALGLPQVYFLPAADEKRSVLADLQFAMPFDDGIRRQFRRPVVDNDGSIEYPKLSGDTVPPDNIEGYERDPENPWRFTPVWPECVLRAQGVKLKPNGCIDVAMVCQHPQAEQFSQPIGVDACLSCPIRAGRRSASGSDTSKDQ